MRWRSANVFHLVRAAVRLAELGSEHAAKQLEENLEAGLTDGRVVAAFAELVADEGVLGPGELVEAKSCAGLAHLEPNQVAPGVGHVRVLDPEDERYLAPDARQKVERVSAVRRRGRRRRVGARVRAQRARVDVGWEVAHRGGYAGVELF